MSDPRNKAQFVFVRDEPKMFEAPDWIPNKERLYYTLNNTYRVARQAEGAIRAERLVKDWLDLLVDFGMSVAVDAHNSAIEQVQEIEKNEQEAKKPHPLSREARAARAALKNEVKP